MSVLLRLGLIKRGERTKAQFYHVNLDLFDLWKLLWTKEIEEGTEDVETYDDLIKEALQEGLDEGYDEISGKFSDFLSLYISNYLEEYEESTIREMMVGDFLQGALIFEKELDPPEKGNFSWFFGITHILENLYQEGYRRGYEPTKEALEEISGR